MPKYKIADEAFQTQNIAKSRAFGRDRAVQTAQEDLDVQAATSAQEARDVSDSTTSLLSTIAAISANQTQAKRGLAQQEAEIQRANVGDLYQANQAMIDEKDKMWRQNVYAPWELRLNELAAKRRRRQAVTDSIVGGITGMGPLMNWGGGIDGVEGGGGTQGNSDAGGIVGAIFSDINLKENVEKVNIDTDKILDLDVIEYNYIGDNEKHIGLIAQQVKEVIPEAVGEKNGYLFVDYNKIVPTLLLVLKQQQSQIELLKSKIN